MHAFDPRHIAVACATYYPNWYPGTRKNIQDTDKVRGDIALKFLVTAASFGYHVVVVDGKSSPSFRLALESISITKILLHKTSKRSPARRHAIRAASSIAGVSVIVISEPEKLSLLAHIESIVQPILMSKADMVIPARNKNLFQKTYPRFQYISETKGNTEYNEILRRHGLIVRNTSYDILFGPRALRNNPTITRLFMKRYHGKSKHIDPEELSNALYFPLVWGFLKKRRIRSVEIPFSYPIMQKENEEGTNRTWFEKKREDQRKQLLLELRCFLSSSGE